MEMKWNRIDEELPIIGKRVILCINRIVQNETYYRDTGDDDGGDFWDRDWNDEGILLKSDHLWMYLPNAPGNG